MNTDRIEKSILLRAPRARVWSAIADARQFGAWFGVEFDGPFVEGQALTGRIRPTQVDAEVAKMQEPYSGHPFEWVVERIEPQQRLCCRWHPYAIEPGVDYAAEPMTEIVFELREEDGGTRLTITESGFDRIPLARRAKAFAANDGGWAHQLLLVQKYLALQPHGADHA